MNFVQLPPEFAGLEGRVKWVQRVNDNTYTSSCPNCGVDETKHSDGNPSDRFIMWIESRVTGKPFGMCYRHCGWKWTPHKQDVEWTPEEKAVFAAKRKELNEQDEKRIREYAENVVMKQAVYIKYLEQMKTSKYGQEYLRRRWFNSNEWNHWFGFGIIEDYKCKGYIDTYYTPAITIPITGLGNVVEQVKLRVAEAHHDKDRFRNLYKTNAQHPYFPMREDKVGNKVAVFEGEMKAAFVAMWGNLPNDTQIIATQGKGIGMRMLYILENAEVVYLCLDPDAFVPNEKGNTSIIQAARKIGFDRVRIIPCKEKIDDAIMKGYSLINAYNMAISPSYLGLKG